MKKKLILGLGLVVCVFIMCGIILITRLAELRLVSDLMYRQQKITMSYDRLLFLINDDQSDLYAFEAGYKRNLDMIRNNIRESRLLLSFLGNAYSIYSSQTACKHCHLPTNPTGPAETLEIIQQHKKSTEVISARIAGYEKTVNRILASGDIRTTLSIVKEAARDSEDLENLLEKARDSMNRMNDDIEQWALTELMYSKYTIAFAIALSVLLSAAIIIAIVRAITRPVNMLVGGIQDLSSGNFTSKVSITSNDEMGFIARSFNEMTSSLARITGEREALITEVRGMNNQLEQRVHEATEQLKMAHEKMLRSETLSAVGTFASGVAHELATPLSSVLSYFQTVKRSIPAEARLAEDIGIIESELTRCIGILRGMLSFARAPEMEKTVTNINAVISELLALFRYQTEYKKVTIIEELGRDVPDIVAVPGQLKQVFLNIILNALQSMTSGGELTVSTFAAGEGEGRRVAVRISDTGEGIADDEINKIFRPFYTTKKSGTGLGLALSYGIIRGHGGDIEVNNNAEKGTTFIVYLPVSLPIASNAALSKGPAGVSQT